MAARAGTAKADSRGLHRVTVELPTLSYLRLVRRAKKEKRTLKETVIAAIESARAVA